jgi:hypothetical protein
MTEWKPCRAKCDRGRYLVAGRRESGDVPVCPRCGGLGLEADDSAFLRGVAEVREARFDHCPYEKHEDMISQPPAYLRLHALYELMGALERLETAAGASVSEDCFLRDLLAVRDSRGPLYELVVRTRQQMADDLATWHDDPEIRRPANRALWPLISLAISGRLDEAERGLRDQTDWPNTPSAETLLCVARFFSEFRRDWLSTLPFLKEARRVEPGCGEIHLELVSAYAALGRQPEMELSFMDAMDCPDIQQHPQLVRARRLIAIRQGRAPLKLVDND